MLQYRVVSLAGACGIQIVKQQLESNKPWKVCFGPTLHWLGQLGRSKNSRDWPGVELLWDQAANGVQ